MRGLILDLRRNGGGSLEEAINLTGLFIHAGPVVQTRDLAGTSRSVPTTMAQTLYNGPLIVLTSRFSASASEIVAGALQDYGRALIVGDSSTFGKGTVQTMLPLGSIMERDGVTPKSDPGALENHHQQILPAERKLHAIARRAARDRPAIAHRYPRRSAKPG